MPWSTDPGHRRGQPPAQRARIMRHHNGVCHVCRHPGGDNIDHIVNVATWHREHRAGSPHRDSNLAPIHQAPCPTCGQRCHVDKTHTESMAARTQLSRHRPTERHPGLI